MPFRLEICGVHDVGREAALGVRSKKWNSPGRGNWISCANSRQSSAPKPSGEVDDLAERLGRHVAAEIDALVAEATHDGEVLRGEIDEEGPALVRDLPPCRSASASNSSVTTMPGMTPRRKARAAVLERTYTFARTCRSSPSRLIQRTSSSSLRVFQPTWLITNRAPARDLLPQLEVLRHHLALVQLVVRDDSAQEEVGSLEPRVGPAHVGQAGVHVREEADQPDRVDVEDRRREASVTHHRIVAGQCEHVLESRRAELPAATLERVPVPVLAREVDDHLLSARDQIGPQRVRREHRVTARVVRDREDVDPGIRGEVPREL